jgi:signal transduction histidine kinase/CheY-like chemotaxis protein
MLETLPALDDSVSRLLAGSITDRARALQHVQDEAHGREVARAGIFSVLLYVVAVALAAYVAYLFLRLRANARNLRDRLDTERVLASITAPFINLPGDSVDRGITQGIARLAKHQGFDRTRVIVPVPGESRIDKDYIWLGPNVSAPSGDGDEILRLAAHWPFEKYECRDGVHIPDIQELPDGPEKSRLQESGIRSWLSMPMSWAGKRVGFLVADSTSSLRQWSDDSIALTRAVADILANAIERRRSEFDRQALEVRLNQAQRLESIGTLAGGIAHEFNNILGAISGYAELTLSGLTRGSSAERYVQNILIAGERAQMVIDQILTFGRRSEREPRQVIAKSAIAEAVGFLGASLPSTVVIETTFSVGNATVMADPTELQQVVINLCTNAAHAMKNHGTLHVELDAIDLAGPLTLSHGQLSAGRYVRLSVKDTGSGIDAATLERIFEPFFTTKAVGEGTGLGLSTVHGIVTQHGGALNVQSSPGAGSTFQAYFLHAGEAAADQESLAPRLVSHGHGETILIVDDDATLVPLAEETLATLGYEAVGFNRSIAALEAFRAAPDRFDLVLTDDIMPEMTGSQLAAALHEIRPNVPILLMTGGGRLIRSPRLEAVGVREVVRKPLLSAQIAELLTRHLPSPSGLAEESRG